MQMNDEQGRGDLMLWMAGELCWNLVVVPKSDLVELESIRPHRGTLAIQGRRSFWLVLWMRTRGRRLGGD